jgi:hypothetical protein
VGGIGRLAGLGIDTIHIMKFVEFTPIFGEFDVCVFICACHAAAKRVWNPETYFEYIRIVHVSLLRGCEHQDHMEGN